MTAPANLIDRIEAEFAAMAKKVEKLQSQRVQEFQGRQQRLEKFSQDLEQLREIWFPRLVALADKFDKQVDVKTHVEPGQRSATFNFKSELAHIKLRFGVLPDDEVRNLVFTYDLDILPILMKFDSHAELEMPLDAIDEAALGNWIDDHIISFVKTYFSLHENQYYLKDHMVEDPVAGIKFPKFAAANQLAWEGDTYYFISDDFMREFMKKNAVPSSPPA